MKMHAKMERGDEKKLQHSPWDASSIQNPESHHRGKAPSDKLAIETPGLELGTEWLYRGYSGQQSGHYDLTGPTKGQRT